jgi:integrase
LLGVRRRTTLGAYASEHLVKKAKSGRVTEGHLAGSEHALESAISFFGADRDLASIGVEHVQAWVHFLAERDNGRGGKLSTSSQRHYLSALGNLFRRAQSESIIRGVNPVDALMDKPQPEVAEAPWLEVWEGALLLEAARTYPYGNPEDASAGRRLAAVIGDVLGIGEEAHATFLRRMRAAGMRADPQSFAAYLAEKRVPTKTYLLTAAKVLGVSEDRLWRRRGWLAPSRPARSLYPILATFLLTGGRKSEVFGLEMRDVSLERGTVTFRPNQWRRIKTWSSRRSVPLWPQLREILAPHVALRQSQEAKDDDLLFPSGEGGMITSIDKALDVIAGHVGWAPGEVRTKAFRHAYCSARLQTLDRGLPVAEYTVAKEMGHGGAGLVRKVYGHLGGIRHRSELVEYRFEQQRGAVPPERLRLLLRAV